MSRKVINNVIKPSLDYRDLRTIKEELITFDNVQIEVVVSNCVLVKYKEGTSMRILFNENFDITDENKNDFINNISAVAIDWELEYSTYFGLKSVKELAQTLTVTSLGVSLYDYLTALPKLTEEEFYDLTLPTE